MTFSTLIDINEQLFNGDLLASDPTVYREGNEYVMLYTDLDPVTQGTVISIARSTDGTNWTLSTPDGASDNTLLNGDDFGFDNFEAAGAFQVGQTHFVMASSYPNQSDLLKGFPADLYLYSYNDAQEATQIGNGPVLERTPGWYDNDAIYSPTIVETDDGFMMYYVGHCYTDASAINGAAGVYLLSATSQDGVNWVKQPEPILSPAEGPAWASLGFAEPDLVRDADGTYHLFFTALDGDDRVIGYARSDDPFGPFEFAPDPIIVPGEIGGENVTEVLAPSVIIENGEVAIWFLAYDAEGHFQIAEAETTVDELAALLPSAADATSDQPEPLTDDGTQDDPEPLADDAAQNDPEPLADNGAQDDPEPHADDGAKNDPEQPTDDGAQNDPEPLADNGAQDDPEPPADDGAKNDPEQPTDDGAQNDPEPLADDSAQNDPEATNGGDDVPEPPDDAGSGDGDVGQETGSDDAAEFIFSDTGGDDGTSDMDDLVDPNLIAVPDQGFPEKTEKPEQQVDDALVLPPQVTLAWCSVDYLNFEYG